MDRYNSYSEEEEIELSDLSRNASNNATILNNKKKLTKVKKFKEMVSSKTLTSGNPSRDSLSNERTMLAYTRTCISFILLGVSMIQFTKYSISESAEEQLEKILEYPNAHTDLINNIRQNMKIVKTFGKPTGVICLIAGTITAILGILRYFSLQDSVFPLSNSNKESLFESGSVYVVIVFILALIVSLLILICISLF